MRILALLSVLIALASVSLVTATAVGQDDQGRAAVPEFGDDFPRLMPMSTPEAATATTTLSRGGIDDIAVIAAIYWLLLAGAAAARAVAARPQHL